MTGFVSALAILIFLAQVPYLRKGGAVGAALVVIGLALLFVVPRLTKAVPAPLIAIVVLTIAVVAAGLNVPDVGDEGTLPSTLPILGIPSVPFSLATLSIILPFSVARRRRPARVADDRKARRRHHRDAV